MIPEGWSVHAEDTWQRSGAISFAVIMIIFLLSALAADATGRPEYFEYTSWYLSLGVLMAMLLANEKSTRALSARLDAILEVLQDIRAVLKSYECSETSPPGRGDRKDEFRDETALE